LNMKYILTVFLIIFTLLQGGFTDAVWSLCGLILAVYLLFRVKKMPPMPVLIPLVFLGVLYMVSIVFHGVSFEGLAALMRVGVVVLLLFVFYNPEADLTEAVFITGMVVAGIGLAALLGLFHWEGAVTGNRLQSTFQYANAAGFFLGIAAFLTRLNPKRAAFAPFMEVALVLTQSVGALAVYVIGWIIYFMKNKNNSRGLKIFKFTVSRKWLFGLSGVVLFVGFFVVLFIRGFRPVATYLERLIHIWDGLMVMLRFPLGIGPGAWQFELFAHQSAIYSASKIHSEFIAVGVNAGVLAVILVLFPLVYWWKNNTGDNKAICVIMILLNAVMDIPFSFLPIIGVGLWLMAVTLPTAREMRASFQLLFLIPLVLCGIVFVQAAMKNHAQWVAVTNPAGAAEILARLPIRNDTGAILQRLAIYLHYEQHDLLDEAFNTLPRPDTIAHFRRTQSLIRRELYEEAAYSAIATMETGPHRRVASDLLLEQILPNLSEARAAEVQYLSAALRPNINPLRRLILHILGEEQLW